MKNDEGKKINNERPGPLFPLDFKGVLSEFLKVKLRPKKTRQKKTIDTQEKASN